VSLAEPDPKDHRTVLSPETGTPRPWCLFKSNARPFAVGVEAVAEVVEADRLVRLSLCPPQILGLCTVRRDVVPVVSLTDAPRDPSAEPEPRTIVLILHSEHGAWGIRIDREGTAVAEGVLEGLDDDPLDAQGPAIIGTLHRGELAHDVIDPAQTWRNARECVEAWYRQ
jgi:purine-binding chemotaxis protein CheW